MNRLGSIRTRLILTFLAVVMISLSGFSLMQVVSGARSAQDEINRQVSAIVSFKAQIIREWASTLKADLGNALAGELAVADVQKIINQQSSSGERELLRSRMLAQVARSRYYTELFLLNPQGEVVLATVRALEGQSFAGQDFFEAGKWVSYVSAPMLSPLYRTTVIYAAYPVLDQDNQVVGVLAGQAKYEPLDNIFKDPTGQREPADIYLLNPQGVILVGSNPEFRDQEISPLKEWLSQAAQDHPVLVNYTNLSGAQATGAFMRLPDLQGVLLVEQERQEVFRTWGATLAVNLSVTISSALVALFIALWTTRRISNPIRELADIAAQIADSANQQGKALGWEDEAAGEAQVMPTGPLASQSQELHTLAGAWQDEIGTLAQAFTQMTGQLSGLIGGLERIVEQRTRDLEQYARFLEASADVSRAAASILDPERLLEQAVELIRDRFDLYYVGLFLNDIEGEWAVLRAGTGRAGQIMLARGHRLRIEPTSMIGWCIANDQPRVAQVASLDEVRFATPELPDTRSEAALPLHARGQVIGAISVQSARPSAFDAATLNVLQSMADQLAIAIDNANLFAQSRQALEAERRAYALSSQAEWREWAQSAGELSLRSDPLGRLQPATDWYPEMDQAFHQEQTILSNERLAIPIRVRGNVIGVISASRPLEKGSRRGRGWMGDEVAFLENIAEQLGVALDSARLYAQTRQRAEQERMVDELTERMRATLDIQTVLETAARELRSALGLAEVEVRLGEARTNGSEIETTDADDLRRGNGVQRHDED